jgi:preprotein translocase subunit SecA
VNRQQDFFSELDQSELDHQVAVVRSGLRRYGLIDRWIVTSFALIREISFRQLGYRHFDTQLLGGWLLLQGVVAEMSTGEGKTLAATLAAGTAGMAGLPVHVITVNDYLTRRDEEEMGPVYHALGLTTGTVVHDRETAERQQAYGCDIVYCTGKELVFDYLRDKIELGGRGSPLQHCVAPLLANKTREDKLLLRGLHFAIVDEADSVLIDEARTPLIISGTGGGEYEQLFLQQALETARRLEQGEDFKLDQAKRTVSLTDNGGDSVEQMTAPLGALWSGRVRREESICQALNAIHLFHLDQHYLVRDGKVEIIDQLTGRVSEGRAWERGLHQLIELKEGCELSQQRATIAKISYQNFFRRYLHLAGMTGTASELRRELWQVYGLPVFSVPPNRPCIRQIYPTRVYPGQKDKWLATAKRVAELTAQGRAVLIGTASVAASELACEIFRQQGLEFEVLNAKQDKEEADIIARAGQPGRITIATSMAGRGTDIKLADIVRRQGGLHVILSERYESARVDRQLAGRGGRQGDPGSFEMILSADKIMMPGWLFRLPVQYAQPPVVGRGWGNTLLLAALRHEQKQHERRSYQQRLSTQKFDQRQDELLSIAGLSE